MCGGPRTSRVRYRTLTKPFRRKENRFHARAAFHPSRKGARVPGCHSANLNIHYFNTLLSFLDSRASRRRTVRHACAGPARLCMSLPISARRFWTHYLSSCASRTPSIYIASFSFGYHQHPQNAGFQDGLVTRTRERHSAEGARRFHSGKC